MPTTLYFQVVTSEEMRGFANQFFGRTYLFTHSSEPLLLNSTAAQLFDDKGNALFPTVLLDWVEWEGPLLSEAEKSRRAGVLPPDETTGAVPVTEVTPPPASFAHTGRPAETFRTCPVVPMPKRAAAVELR
jgi:hypothetical protein